MLNATAVAADPPPPPPQLVTAVEGITEYRLDNGLKVLLFPDPSKPQVTVNLTIFVGSRHEGYGEAGMAHLLEHMVFKGTPDFPEPSSIPKALKDHGAQFNGTTWLDRTNYFETLPASAENLEFAIRLEADRMMNSFIRGEDLASEMSVVRNEFEMGENSPNGILLQRMMALAFEWHNYGKDTIGNRADIERVPVDNLREFYRKFYQPDNAMLVVGGNFDPEQALGFIQKYFGSIPRPERKLAETYTEEPAQDGERSVTLRRVGDVALAGALYHIPAGAHPDYVSLDVLEHVLGGTPSGRLYKALVETRRAASISGNAYSLHDPGVMYFLAEVAAGNDPRDVLATMTEIIESVAEDGVTEEEVERSKRYWMKEWELAQANSGRLAVQLSEWAAQGDWRLMFVYRDRLEQVTPESVQAVARKYLQQNNRTVGLFIPTREAQRISVPRAPELAEMIGDYKGRESVSAGEQFDVSPAGIEARTQRVTLPGGIKAALLPKKTRGESVRARLTLRYGNLESLRGKSAACDILPSLMMRGTKQLTRQQIQDEQDKNRARIQAGGGAGEATFTIETRREFLPNVVNLLRQVLREATLPPEELEILRTKKIADLEQQLTDPEGLATVAVLRQISPYERGDVRYVPTIPEDIQRWKALTHDEVALLYREYLNGAHGELAIVGDFDPAEIVPLVEEAVAGWTAPQKFARIPRIGDVDLRDQRQEILTPDKENAVYFAGTVLPMNDSDPDYAGLVMGNDVLGGGGLASRLANRVRQQEGLSYGVGSGVNAAPIDRRAVFYIHGISNPVNMPKLEVAVREELNKLLKDGVTSSELAAAQNGYLERQKVNRSDDGQLAQVLARNLEAGRDMSFYADLEKRITALTPEQVQQVLRKRIDPKRITLVVAGDFEKARREAPEK